VAQYQAHVGFSAVAVNENDPVTVMIQDRGTTFDFEIEQEDAPTAEIVFEAG
jgi:hypothetical protein